MQKKSYIALISNRRILATLFLAFSSGLPFSLIGTTLQAWYTVLNIPVEAIGFLGLVGLPYAWKILWAPFIDRYIPPFLGRRRGWIMIMQCAIAVVLALMAFCHPNTTPVFLAFLALIVGFLSASQDIAIDAYRVDLLEEDERGLGASVTVGGYRVAIIFSGAIAMALAQYIGWRDTYLIMSGTMLCCVLFTFYSPEAHYQDKPVMTLQSAVIEPFLDFICRYRYLSIVFFCLIISYKLGDLFSASLATTFLLKLHFSLVEVSAMNKVLGVISAIVGAIVGGIILSRISLFKGLIYFGLVQAISNVMYVLLAIVGKNYLLFGLTVFAENFCSGLGTSAFFALLMGLCTKRFSATQYALFSAIFGFARVIISPISGVMVTHIGWVSFFTWSFIFSLPGLLFVLILKKQIDQIV